MPLMPGPLWYRVICRFIPTPVGNTKGGAKNRMSSTVHPHACGEHFAAP